MPKTSKVFLNMHWHQHQPWYLAPSSREAEMPWVRLHGVKDYYDIAWLSQHFEGWKQTINLVPSLIEQLQAIATGSATDRLLELSRKPADALAPEEKTEVLTRFFDAHAPRMIHPFPRYGELFRKRGKSAANSVDRFSVQDIRDLQVWHNLCWIDPIWREDATLPLVELVRKQRNFSEADKQAVLDLQIEIIRQIVPLHRDLQQQGKLELTCTPYYHPILPLLCDTSIARISNPNDPVPEPAFVYPEDAEWHIREGLRYFEQVMGFRPLGMWPSEGSVSDRACALMAKAGVTFFATDEGILAQSNYIDPPEKWTRNEIHRLHRLQTSEGDIDCVFRDHGLSDLIGFVYQNKDPKEAARDFISHLHAIGKQWPDKQPPLINVILDGENCWEFYPRDGHDFLRYLIEGILADPQIIPTTVPEYRKIHPPEPTLSSIHPGSWINGNYRIWIGHKEDNAAWHYLRQAREVLARNLNDLDESTREAAWKQIHICEGSDWFWWFGDDNYCAHDTLFDSLFRDHLSYLYDLIGLPVPESLKRPIKQPRKVRKGEGGILFRRPVASRNGNGYYDWIGAKSVTAGEGGGAMHQAGEIEARLRYGRLNNTVSFLVQILKGAPLDENTKVELHLTIPDIKTIQLFPSDDGDRTMVDAHRFEGVAELSPTGIDASQEVWFYIQFHPQDAPPFSLPSGSELYLPGYTAANASVYWFM